MVVNFCSGARLAKFSRAEIRNMRRRISAEPGPAGDRQTVLVHLSLLYSAEKPMVLAPEETLLFPIAIVIGCLLGVLVRAANSVAPTALPRSRADREPSWLP